MVMNYRAVEAWEREIDACCCLGYVDIFLLGFVDGRLGTIAENGEIGHGVNWRPRLIKQRFLAFFRIWARTVRQIPTRYAPVRHFVLKARQARPKTTFDLHVLSI
ncbi:hypothetical protein M0R45_014894 [Rubus argutus]|uniref:Uncharacterized protein n=1 Tax=Rubus argutus TaxID=59490 RepID=A0AAW1XN37_RUBAR